MKDRKEQKPKLFITVPGPASELFHVFGDDNRSLCGKFAILNPRKDMCDPCDGHEQYQKGQDCKACFDKSKRLLGIPKVSLLSKEEYQSPANQNRDNAIIGYKNY